MNEYVQHTTLDSTVELSATTFSAIVSFFEQRGFDPLAASSISTVIIRRAKLDEYDPMTVLDSIRSYSHVELNNLISEILNYNRQKTSYLGRTDQTVLITEIERNSVL